MHLADGILSLPVAVTTSAAAGALLVYSARGVREEEIPKVSLMTGAFFVSTLISIPVGPSTVHPLLGGLLGLVLGKRAPVGIFVGLLLQAALFQHGGLTTLGANTLIFSIPALLVYLLLGKRPGGSMFIKGALAGSLAIMVGLLLLVGLLFLTDERFGEGVFSVINVLVSGHLFLAVVEGILTGFAVKFLYQVKPGIFSNMLSKEQGKTG